jgi:hypothetical protein
MVFAFFNEKILLIHTEKEKTGKKAILSFHIFNVIRQMIKWYSGYNESEH